MTQSEMDEKADEYFNAIQSPILDDADDDTRNAAYRYVQAAIANHVRSINGNNNNQQGNQQNGQPNDGDKDDFNWGEGDNDDDLDGKKPENDTNPKKKKDSNYMQRILNTADVYKKNFTW